MLVFSLWTSKHSFSFLQLITALQNNLLGWQLLMKQACSPSPPSPPPPLSPPSWTDATNTALLLLLGTGDDKMSHIFTLFATFLWVKLKAMKMIEKGGIIQKNCLKQKFAARYFDDIRSFLFLCIPNHPGNNTSLLSDKLFSHSSIADVVLIIYCTFNSKARLHTLSSDEHSLQVWMALHRTTSLFCQIKGRK